MCVVQPAAPVAPAPVAAPAASAETEWQDASTTMLDEAASGHVFQRRASDTLYLDFPEVKQVNTSADLYLRLLPAAKGAADPNPHVGIARHRLSADLDPETRGNQQWIYPECFNVRGGPGECPIDAVLWDLKATEDEDAVKWADGANARAKYLIAAIDLKDPQRHFRQVIHNGSPVFDPATGQPMWEIVPGVVTIGRELFKTLTTQNGLFAKRSHGASASASPPQPGASIFHPDFGINVYLVKKKTGPADMNVEYDAALDPQGASALPAQFRTWRPLDLRSLVRYYERARMEAIAENIRKKWSHVLSHRVTAPVPAAPPRHAPAPVGTWQVHPNNPAYEWNPTTNDTRPRAAAPVPPPVPAAAPPPPVAAYAPPPPPVAPPAPPAVAYAPPPPPVTAPLPPYAVTPPAPPLAAPLAAPPPPVAPYVPAAPYAPPAPAYALPPAAAPGVASGAFVPPVLAPVTPGMPSAALPPLPPPPTAAFAPPPPPPGLPHAGMSPAQIEAEFGGSDIPSFP